MRERLGASSAGSAMQVHRERRIAMTTRLILPVDGPFSLGAAASFGFGPNSGRPFPDGLMRLAFVADDLRHHVGAVVTQLPDGTLAAEVSGDAPVDAAEAQLRRILSIDTGVAGWLEAGKADPVLGSVQAAHPGLRPVLFHSPYEAAAARRASQLGRRLARAADAHALAKHGGTAPRPGAVPPRAAVSAARARDCRPAGPGGRPEWRCELLPPCRARRTSRPRTLPARARRRCRWWSAARRSRR